MTTKSRFSKSGLDKQTGADHIIEISNRAILVSFIHRKLSRSVDLPDSDDHREIMKDYTSIYDCFSESYQEQLKRSLENNKRLPQEIISYAVLLQEMR